MSLLIGFFLAQAQTTRLDQIDLSKMTSGYSVPNLNKSIEGKPLTLNGKVFEHGVGTHAVSQANLLLDHASSFDATVGVDDETKGKGSVEFLIEVDGRVKWRSGILRGNDHCKKIHVNLTGAKTMALIASDAGDGSGYDHADWAEATFTGGSAPIAVRDLRPVTIETKNSALQLFVDSEGHLMQRSFGAKISDEPDAQLAYPLGGDGWTFEPALSVTHADGNTSLDLKVISIDSNATLTKITLKDPAYGLQVNLFFRPVTNDDVIEAWTEVINHEKGTVTLRSFASSAPDFGSKDMWLTQFHGNWAQEAQMSEEKLGYGIKTLDSKLGVRADQFRAPWFLLSRNAPAKEDSGEVFGGSLAWSGSYRFDFEKLPEGRVRATCGINPFDSAYHLSPGSTFTTPKMIWAWSNHGTGELSRKLHRYVRSEVIRDGDKPRDILLNNWESTYFDFDEKKLVSLFKGAKDLGMELFLLDDGWFGVKYPRDGDSQGLGDWTPNPKKLPNGIGALTKAASANGLRFGLWFEPEMVNPKSVLFEKHPDWVIHQPKRPFDLSRNQMILDLTNPVVAKYVFDLVDKSLTENQGITYVKWDCNRFITQPGSDYLGKDKQSHLWVDYVRSLYSVMNKLTKKHPGVELMMCSGGGGRVDYGAMRFAQEYWPSDMTDPAHRIFIQWGYSHFFPPMASANHVTLSGDHGLKFAFEVAMSGTMGMDIDVSKLSPADYSFAKQAIASYKGIRNIVQLGEEYRLESPYEGPRSALMDVENDSAALFVYSLGDSPAAPVKLKGLDRAKRYSIRLIDYGIRDSSAQITMSGSALIDDGLPVGALKKYESSVFRITALK